MNQLILSISFLQQCTPELVSHVGTAVDQLPILCRQQIINHHLCPLSKAPEAETENPSVFPWVFRVPFLLVAVWNHLRNHGRASSASAGCPGTGAVLAFSSMSSRPYTDEAVKRESEFGTR